MRLTPAEALTRLATHDHGVLSTLNPDRGIDAVPCVFAVERDGFVGVPIDTVKPKSSTRLQRQRNLEHHPRATLLVDHWDRVDWSRLWWVRAELLWVPEPTPQRVESLSVLLSERYPQYADRPFAAVMVLRIDSVTGWSAHDRPDAPH